MNIDAFETGGRPTRRDMLRTTLGAFGLTALGPIGEAFAATRPSAIKSTPAANQKFLVVVELDGGNDGLNMVVPQGLSNYALRRPSLALDTNASLAIDTGLYATGEFRLHNRMPRLAQMYRDGELGIVSKVGYPDANQSHDTSKLIWASGQRDGLLGVNGWIARYAELAAPTSLGAIGVRRGRHRSLTGGSSNPLTLDTLAAFRFDNDSSFTANHNKRLEIIRNMLAAQQASAPRDALLTGHELADQISAAVSGYISTATYGTSRIGLAMRDIAMMLQANFETRVFYTGFGGFDTHAAQGTTTGKQPDLLEDLDEAMFGFAEDCKAMGIWNNAVVVVMSEFGRRNFENGSGGTDHGGANTVLITGGAARGGLHGEKPTDADLERNFLPYSVDFRAIYSDILRNHLGMTNVARVFSEPYQSPVQVDVV